MIQTFASVVVNLWDALAQMEVSAKTWNAFTRLTPDQQAQISALLKDSYDMCDGLQLASAIKQVKHIGMRSSQGNCSSKEFADCLAQLRTRIREDLDDKIFFCIADGILVQRYFSKQVIDPTWGNSRWVFKRPDELFDPIIIGKFPSAASDIDEACRCYVMDRYMASVFHAMRIVEIGLLKVATLAGITDSKPSWGAVLSQLDKYAFKTKYEDLPESVRPYREKIKAIIPRMQAIQHAWRNKVDHATLVPTNDFDESGASEILGATQSFMRSLANELF